MSFYSKWIGVQLDRHVEGEDIIVDYQTMKRIRDVIDDLEYKAKELEAVKKYLELRRIENGS